MKTKVALIGVGGFGKSHTSTIMKLAEEGILECTAFAETNPDLHAESCKRWTSAGAAHYQDYKEMLRRHPEIELVAIATPIPLHKPMSMYVMGEGFNVILEKPPAVTIQDLDPMIEAGQKAGKLCQVDFQNTSGKAFRLCLEKLREGAIGEVKRVTGVGIWKRMHSYYARTAWAGKLIHNGQYVLDGTIFNPFSHLLNNCLLAAGKGDGAEAKPKTVQAELYKAYAIDGEDTACVRIRTVRDVEILLYTTLCGVKSQTPYIHIVGTEGEIRWYYDNNMILTNSRGEQEKSSFGSEDLIRNMYVNAVDVIHNGGELYSPLEACRSFILVGNGAFESSKGTHSISEAALTHEKTEETTGISINGIADIIADAAANGKLFSESGVGWAVATEPFDMKDYTSFQLFR